MNSVDYLRSLLYHIQNRSGNLAPRNNVFIVFDSTPGVVYEYDYYETYKAKCGYKTKNSIIRNDKPNSMDDVYDALVNATEDVAGIKVARLSKTSHGIRIRFDCESLNAREREYLIDAVLGNLNYVPGAIIAGNAHAPVATPLTPVSVNKEVCSTIAKGKDRHMGDFSLTNLKDALVNKVTHLDRKTVMILAIIALILLIVGKYTTIKDILIGIKDKIKRSKNFKAMMEDGTNAVNSLKKIVGVKGASDEA